MRDLKKQNTLYNQYKHGGGYKKAAQLEGLNWEHVSDYSTSLNWKATEFYPESLIYPHRENIEYPDPEYKDLKETIETYHGYDQQYFLMTHGANEAISYLFHMFLLQGFKDVALAGSTYSEYNKCCDLNGFNTVKVSYDELYSLKDKIIVIVNPNTPFGTYLDLKSRLENLLNQGNTVVVDESFIDFTDKPSMYELVEAHPNLFTIHSMTKFYGSAGARLGLILSSNKLLQEFMSILLPPWTISAYDSWFYTNMIPKYNEIKSATLAWILEINKKAGEIINKSSNIKSLGDSITCYRTLTLEKEVPDIRKFFLNEYKIYVRPTSDFFGCPTNSFRVGLRLPQENEPLWRAIEDIV